MKNKENKKLLRKKKLKNKGKSQLKKKSKKQKKGKLKENKKSLNKRKKLKMFTNEYLILKRNMRKQILKIKMMLYKRKRQDSN